MLYALDLTTEAHSTIVGGSPTGKKKKKKKKKKKPAPDEPEPEAPDDLTDAVAEVMEADQDLYELTTVKKARRMVEKKLGLPKKSLDGRKDEVVTQGLYWVSPVRQLYADRSHRIVPSIHR